MFGTPNISLLEIKTAFDLAFAHFVSIWVITCYNSHQYLVIMVFTVFVLLFLIIFPALSSFYRCNFQRDCPRGLPTQGKNRDFWTFRATGRCSRATSLRQLSVLFIVVAIVSMFILFNKECCHCFFGIGTFMLPAYSTD